MARPWRRSAPLRPTVRTDWDASSGEPIGDLRKFRTIVKTTKPFLHYSSQRRVLTNVAVPLGARRLDIPKNWLLKHSAGLKAIPLTSTNTLRGIGVVVVVPQAGRPSLQAAIHL